MRIVLSGDRLSLEEVGAAARGGARVEIAAAARERVRAARALVERIAEGALELLLEMLHRDVIPVVPEKGSVGASGDLAPLAHLALVLIGQGEAFAGGQRLPGREALARSGLQPVVLEAKEGLALVNG